MSEEDKLKVHSLVDAKLAELEATNLSREEILFDDGRVFENIIYFEINYNNAFNLERSSFNCGSLLSIDKKK